MICKVPHCGNELHPKNEIGVCKGHIHMPGHCGCLQCRGLSKKRRYRVKTREELIEEGLLPRDP